MLTAVSKKAAHFTVFVKCFFENSYKKPGPAFPRDPAFLNLVTLTYELPHIDMPGDYIKDLNREIYNTFMTNPANFEYIRYSYYVLGNYLTVVIESYASAPTGASVVEYNIYTVDIEKSRPAKTSEVLEAAGMTAEEFHEKALAALLKPYQEDLVKFSMTDTERDAEAETESFLDSAYPYFAEDGSLWVHGRRLTIAGQGSCNAIAPLEPAE